MDRLVNAFMLSFASDEAQLKAGEAQLQEMAKQPGFAMLLMQLLESNVDNGVKVAASIQLRHFIEHNWEDKIGAAEKKQFRGMIVDLMLKHTPAVARQLRATLEVVAKVDWPGNWPELLPLLVQRMQETISSGNVDKCLDVLRTVSVLMKRFNGAEKTDDILLQLRDILAVFTEPMLVVFKGLCTLVSAGAGVAPTAQHVLCLKELAKVFYALNCVDLPEFFEDHMKEFMDGFHALLTLPVAEVRAKGWPREIFRAETSEKPGPLYQLHEKICKCVTLYVERYDEEFGPFLPTFLNDVWTLLLGLSTDSQYDTLAIAGIKFLQSVSSGVFYTHFADSNVLNSVCERIVVANVMLHEDAEELFEDSPRDYIRRDVEGSDVHTRRRAASELVLALKRHYEQQVTALFATHAQQLLATYASNPREQWMAKDAAIFLITAVAVKTSTEALGATAINEAVPIAQFFSTQIAPELQAGAACHPLVKADCLKFMTLFRHFIASTPENARSYLQMMISALSDGNFVVRTYAATGIERLLAIKQANGRFRFDASLIGDSALPLVNCLFHCLDFNDEETALENEYVMKAILRVVAVLKERVAPIASDVFGKAVPLLQRVAQNPRNPVFNHYLFEVVACVSKYTVAANAGALPAIEALVLPVLQDILMKDVIDFFPYAFQLYASFLELAPAGVVAPAYENLFPSLMAPALWERPGTVPAISRLVQAYIRHAGAAFKSSPHLTTVLGIFQMLVANTTTDAEAFAIATTLAQVLDADTLAQYMPAVLGICFQRVTTARATKTHRNFIVFFCRLVLAQGMASVVRWADAVQPNVVAGLVCAEIDKHARAIAAPADRRLCAAAFVHMCCTADVLLTDPYLKAWGCLVHLALLLLNQCSTLAPAALDAGALGALDTPAPTVSGVGTSFSPLAFAVRPDTDTPLFAKLGVPAADLAALRRYLAAGLHAVSAKRPGVLQGVLAEALSPSDNNILAMVFKEASIPPPYLA